MLDLAIWLVVLLLIDLAAWKWGVDSSEGMPDTHTGARYRLY